MYKKTLISIFTLALIVPFVASAAGFSDHWFNWLKKDQAAQVVKFSANIQDQTFARGDRDDSIKEIQEALSDMGIYKGWISGALGPKTEEAIATFQNQNGLELTGKLDKKTYDAIVNGVLKDNNSRGGNTTACGPNDPISVNLIKPNGGESYQYGENVKVQWQSCNLPYGVDIGIDLINRVSSTPLTVASHNLNSQTPDDGIEQVTLVPESGLPAFVLGNNFKIRLYYVGTNDYDYDTYGINPPWMQQYEESDNYFSIGSFTSSTSGGQQANCIEANAVSSYARTINPGVGDQVVAKYEINNNCANQVSIDKMTFSLIAFKGQDLIVSADLFENVSGTLLPVSGTHNFTHTVTPAGQENIRTFVLSTDNNGVSVVTLSPGESTTIEMHAKTQSQIPLVYENPTAFIIGLSDLDYYDFVSGQSGDWTQTSPVWGERVIINAQ